MIKWYKNKAALRHGQWEEAIDAGDQKAADKAMAAYIDYSKMLAQLVNQTK
jgi:DNA-binding FadR family transcriptional regulator